MLLLAIAAVDANNSGIPITPRMSAVTPFSESPAESIAFATASTVSTRPTARGMATSRSKK